MSAFAPSYARVSNDAVQLLVNAFPATALDLIPEWQATLGLPDACAGDVPTLIQQREQIVARLTNTGGQSMPYYVHLAAQLGYTIAITAYAPFRAGQSSAGQQLGNTDWFFTWAVNAPLNTVVPFYVGQSTAGDALGTWSNDVLECEIEAVMPAHTVLQFHFA